MNHKELSSSGIDHNYFIFQTLLDISDYFLKKKQYAPSAACAQIAASHALIDHCGIFASPYLESILSTIGCNTVKMYDQDTRRIPNRKDPKHVLHILSTGRPTGGDTRFVWRWIQEDAERKHSVVLTRQGTLVVPQILSDATLHAGGMLYQLDKLADDLLSRAQKLRDISENCDLIALHLFPDDVIPLLAFADRSNLPPIVFLNHSDHTFWIGSSISDTVAQLRDCSLPLSEGRRGIAKEKIAFLPTPLGIRSRNLSAIQAKRKLGYSDDTVIFLTIATAFKYMPISETSLFSLLTSVLQKHKNIVLLAIGPNRDDLDKAGFDMDDSRIVALGRRSDTAIYYEAADIYIDSYPFSSITSLLEAGSYELPVVTYCSYNGDGKILCAGAPGLSDTMFRCTSIEDYSNVLCKLVENKNYREKTGRKTMQKIKTYHCGIGWKKILSELYNKTIESAESKPFEQKNAAKCNEVIDKHLNILINEPSHLEHCIDKNVQSLPYTVRLRLLLKLLKINRMFSFSMFLPNWLGEKIGGHFTWWRRLPNIDKLLNPVKQ